MTVILSQQFFSGEGVPVGLLTATLTRALALHSRQGREPLRGNSRIHNEHNEYAKLACAYVTQDPAFPACPLPDAASTVHTAPLAPPLRILAVGAEALPVTPSGGALFAS